MLEREERERRVAQDRELCMALGVNAYNASLGNPYSVVSHTANKSVPTFGTPYFSAHFLRSSSRGEVERFPGGHLPQSTHLGLPPSGEVPQSTHLGLPPNGSIHLGRSHPYLLHTSIHAMHPCVQM